MSRVILLADRAERLPFHATSNPCEVLAYLRGVDAGERHGYARGRAEGVQDLVLRAWAWAWEWAR